MSGGRHDNLSTAFGRPAPSKFGRAKNVYNLARFLTTIDFDCKCLQSGCTNSLTHCCAWLAEGRNDLHNERSRVVNWQALMGRPISSSTCWSQVLCGRPGGCFQSVAGGVPVKASMDRCSVCETGVSLDNRPMWPKSEWRRSAMMEGRYLSPVVSFIEVLVILSYHFTPSVEIANEMTGPCRCQFFSCPRLRAI